uniref:Uncharacterized protein n=2 Tax=Arion vulgaris TaxID=1028688 RepID=A0A0B7AUY1_9EUPU
MKGVKVLPSDFRMIKLKPKNEKRTESSDDYDNNKEVMEKYKEYQEREKEVNYTGGIKASVVKTNSQETDGFIDFTEQNKQRTEERSRDFSPQWNETIKEKKSTGRGFDSTGNNVQHIYGDSRDHAQRHEDNNNRNIGQGENWTNKLQPNVGNAGDAHVRTKDLEIANMFSNVKLQDGNDSRNMYRQQQGVRNEIEEGLGYLP